MRFVMDVFGGHYMCVVTHYSAPCPMRITGSGFGDAEPPEEEEFDFFLQDYNGNMQEHLITPEVEAAALAIFKKESGIR